MVKCSTVFILCISFFCFLSDCSNGWSKGRTKRWGIWVDMGPWSQNEPKDIYHQNNNRIDRQKHAQCNQQIHQPRKHNHEMRYNNRRNQ